MLLICTASSGHNLTLSHRLAEIADGMGMETQIVDLTQAGLPLYTPAQDEELKNKMPRRLQMRNYE